MCSDADSTIGLRDRVGTTLWHQAEMSYVLPAPRSLYFIITLTRRKKLRAFTLLQRFPSDNAKILPRGFIEIRYCPAMKGAGLDTSSKLSQ
jgi:hypothetical protein